MTGSHTQTHADTYEIHARDIQAQGVELPGGERSGPGLPWDQSAGDGRHDS